MPSIIEWTEGITAEGVRLPIAKVNGYRRIKGLEPLPVPERANNLPVLINGGHAVHGSGNLTGGNADHAEDNGSDKKSHGQSPSGCKNCDKSTTMTLSDRIISFVKTQAKSAVTGLADQETIDARLAICQQCPHLKNDHCQKCGCACGGGKKYLNKLAHKSSVCPDNPPRWGAVE